MTWRQLLKHLQETNNSVLDYEAQVVTTNQETGEPELLNLEFSKFTGDECDIWLEVGEDDPVLRAD